MGLIRRWWTIEVPLQHRDSRARVENAWTWRIDAAVGALLHHDSGHPVQVARSESPAPCMLLPLPLPARPLLRAAFLALPVALQPSCLLQIAVVQREYFQSGSHAPDAPGDWVCCDAGTIVDEAPLATGGSVMADHAQAVAAVAIGFVGAAMTGDETPLVVARLSISAGRMQAVGAVVTGFVAPVRRYPRKARPATHGSTPALLGQDLCCCGHQARSCPLAHGRRARAPLRPLTRS